MEIFKEFTIEAAHWLPNVAAGHKCGRLHGHSFHIEVHLRGPLDPHLGWVVDFAKIKPAFKAIEDQLDHRCLNEVVDRDVFIPRMRAFVADSYDDRRHAFLVENIRVASAAAG